MLKAVVLLCLVGVSVAQTQYVWDLLKPALNVAEVQAILANRDANQFPTYASVPQTGFRCDSKKQPGFYADTEAQCQVFHRCDFNGNQTSYLCVNSTVFNQVTLVCDYFYNVDCQKFASYENFANSRLYTDQPLFDTPPSSYVQPGAGAAQILTNDKPSKNRSFKPSQRLKVLQNTPFGNKMK
ncbi:U-scoloptoxin(01)-Er1a-like [Paramacrobiotus metropolitanus]|uniref:U-scoloptoxin(01)-Er1a-like n=1 Tax=Paramacrobiotus metropolitanus TaxID=2943436 RepID=UPI0024464B46|nr:U-scoloptoxin(01)-Er1a-like [Paramacrobiotus metropolitanus]